MVSSNTYGIDLPHIPTDLLRALDEKYPDTCPRLEDSERMVWFKAGQRNVIDMLHDQHRRQENAGRDTLVTDAFPATLTGGWE